MDNPFLEYGPELLAIDIPNVIDNSMINTVRTVYAVGKAQYDSCQTSVITNLTKSIH